MNMVLSYLMIYKRLLAFGLVLLKIKDQLGLVSYWHEAAHVPIKRIDI